MISLHIFNGQVLIYCFKHRRTYDSGTNPDELYNS